MADPSLSCIQACFEQMPSLKSGTKVVGWVSTHKCSLDFASAKLQMLQPFSGANALAAADWTQCCTLLTSPMLTLEYTFFVGPGAGARCRCQLPNPVAGCRIRVAGCRLPVPVAGCRLPVPVASCRLPIAGWVAGAGVPCPVAKPRRLYVIIRLYAYMPIYVIRILLKEPQANHKVKLNSERK